MQKVVLALERSQAFWRGVTQDFEDDGLLVRRALRAIHCDAGTIVQEGAEMIRGERGHEDILL
jgi:hypothetical protein